MTSATLPRSETAHRAAVTELGRGEPVVLLHGVGLRSEAWIAQIAALAASHRALALDLPGHGASAPLPAGTDLAGFGAWFVTALDDLGLDTVSVAGHSMGALIAGWTAVHAPGRIRRVALVSGVHRRPAAAAAAVRARAAQIAAGDLDPAAPLERWFPEPGEHADAAAACRRWLGDVDRAGYATAYAAFADGDDGFADDWPRVACPALFLTGELDPNSTPEMSRVMAAAAPHGEAVVVAQHRHMVPMTAPDTVNAALAAWLDRKA